VGRFQKGQSGNPLGRPAGSRNLATIACEALLEGQAERLTEKVIEMALAGDITAPRLCIERLIPIRREYPVSFPLPPIQTAGDVAAASEALLRAVASGEISPAAGAEISKVFASLLKAVETAKFVECADRLTELSDAELMAIAAGSQPRNGAMLRLPGQDSKR
jgi:hypothetical protein